MSDLPYLIIQNPACGACGLDTTIDGDRFICDECGLNYGDGDGYGRAEFINEEAQVCGAACSNDWHGNGKIRREWSYNCHPCRLPEGHTSDHWTDCDLVVDYHLRSTSGTWRKVQDASRAFYTYLNSITERSTK